VTRPAAGQFVNGSFETGNFTGWTTAGTGYVVGTIGTPAVVPPVGNFQGTLQSPDSAPFGADSGFATAAELDTFFGLTNGSIASVKATGSLDPTVGSAITQPVTVVAGQSVLFRWNYVTLESPLEADFNDYSFVVVGNTVIRLLASNDSDNGSLTGPVVTFNGGNYRTSDYQNFSFTFNTAGTFQVGVGVVDVGDTGVASGLLLDDFRLSAVPEPAAWGLLLGSLVLSGGVGWRWRRRLRRQAEAAVEVGA